MKPTKCPAGEKKWGKKSEIRGEERSQSEKVKVKTAVSLLNPKTQKKNLKILLSAHARTFASGSEGREVYDL